MKAKVQFSPLPTVKEATEQLAALWVAAKDKPTLALIATQLELQLLQDAYGETAPDHVRLVWALTGLAIDTVLEERTRRIFFGLPFMWN